MKPASRTGTRLECGWGATTWTTRDNSFKVRRQIGLRGENGRESGRALGGILPTLQRIWHGRKTTGKIFTTNWTKGSNNLKRHPFNWSESFMELYEQIQDIYARIWHIILIYSLFYQRVPFHLGTVGIPKLQIKAPCPRKGVFDQYNISQLN